MDLDELLSLLDAETPNEIVYFEQFADLMEEMQDIPYETLASLAEGMEPAVISELVGGYFEDILSFVPDGEEDLYMLLSNIGTTLQSIPVSSDDASHLFAEELYKFRNWYLFEQCVLCTNLSELAEHEITLFEALTNYRAQSFSDDEYSFDFSEALDYPLDEYIVSLNSIISEEGEYIEEDDEYDDYGDFSDPDDYYNDDE